MRKRVCDVLAVAMSLYGLNLFDVADNDDYRAYSGRSPDAVARHGSRVIALGMRAQHPAQLGDTEPRQALVLVEWRDREAFDGFLAPTPSGRTGPVAG